MTDSNSPNNDQSDDLFDPREPGKARTIYTIVAVIVTISLIVAIGGYAVWDRLF